MNSKPMGYESQKAVLQYMEANQRFQLASHCPSIQKTERLLPLHINFLGFHSISYPNRTIMCINSTKYSFGIYRNYPEGVPIHPVHLAENRKGGVETDLDEFGFKDYSSNKILNREEDVQLMEHPTIGINWSEGEFEKRAIKLKGLKRIVTDLKNGQRFTDVKCHPDLMDILKLSNGSVQDLEEEINRQEALLLPYFNKRANIGRGYSTLAQLTMDSENSENLETSQKFEFFNLKIHQAEKILNQILFGNRKSIFVKNLFLGNFWTILRFPPNLNLKIQNLKVSEYILLHQKNLEKFISPTSFPLKNLKISELSAGNYRRKVLKNAENLVVATLKLNHFYNFSELKNQKIHVEKSFLGPREYCRLAWNWIEKGKEIGSCWTFGFKNKEDISRSIRQIRGDIGGKFEKNLCLLTIALNGFPLSKLQISYHQMETDNDYGPEWTFKWEVVGAE